MGDFNEFHREDGRPTEAERCLIEAAEKGEAADCRDFAEAERIISARLLRSVATDDFRHSDFPDWRLRPEGVGLLGATFEKLVSFDSCRIRGNLLLAFCKFKKGMALIGTRIEGQAWFDYSTFDGEFSIFGAKIAGQIQANYATFRNANSRAVLGQRVTATDWSMHGATVEGAFDISGAELSGQFYASEAAFHNAGACAVRADGVKASGWFMDNTTIEGEFDINGAEIAGQIKADNATFRNPGRHAVLAYSVKAKGWFMRDASVEGEFVFNGTEIVGTFTADGSTFRNPDGRAARAEGIRAADWSMRGTTVEGIFWISGSEITGEFSANDASFHGARDYAIVAHSLRAGRWSMQGAKVEGEFELNGAEIAGLFNADSATFRNPTYFAINASSSRFHGGIRIRGDTQINGGILLERASVKYEFQLVGLTLAPHSGCCLSIANADIDGPAEFFKVTFLGAIDARGARFRSAANLRRATMICDAEARRQGRINTEASEKPDETVRMPNHCLLLREAVFEGRLIMPRECPQGIVDLSRARCDTLEDFSTGWPPELKPGQDVCNDRLCDTKSGRDIQHIVLDGFECRHFEHPSGTARPSGDHVGEARIRWLAGQSAADLKVHFNPQPWRMTSAVLRAMGYEKAADKVSIERRTRQRRADNIPRRSRVMGCLLHHAADYGYNPVKATLWCVMLVVAFSLVFWGLEVACSNGACGPERLFQQVREGDIENTPYPTFEPLLYSLDLFVPILDFGSDTLWRADVTAWPTFKKAFVTIGWRPWTFIHSFPVGWLAHILAIIERVVGAFMVATTIIGLTGLVKREEK